MELNLEEHPEFDRDKHAAYVAKGYCPAVYWTKAYCYLPAGHEGKHCLVLLTPDGNLQAGDRWS